MRNRPPHLKRLVLARGRISGEIERREAAAATIINQLKVARLKIKKLNSRLTACDERIRVYNSRFRPELIEGIHAWRSYPGKRGALRKSIIEILQSKSPDSIDTNQICILLQAKFSLDFEDAEEYARFRHNTVGNALKFFLKKGWVRRLHNPKEISRSGVPGVWKWVRGEIPTLASLKARGRRSTPVPYDNSRPAAGLARRPTVSG